MPEQQTTKEQKIYNLVVELETAKKNKRDVVKAHSEEVKRIQAEIKELLNDNNEAF
jgi:predicted component of type VI protein secretion system